jgi:hypothetical protein
MCDVCGVVVVETGASGLHSLHYAGFSSTPTTHNIRRCADFTTHVHCSTDPVRMVKSGRAPLVKQGVLLMVENAKLLNFARSCAC